jgi:hypothetical protein
MFLGTAGSGTLFLIDCEYGTHLGCNEYLVRELAAVA